MVSAPSYESFQSIWLGPISIILFECWPFIWLLDFKYIRTLNKCHKCVKNSPLRLERYIFSCHCHTKAQQFIQTCNLWNRIIRSLTLSHTHSKIKSVFYKQNNKRTKKMTIENMNLCKSHSNLYRSVINFIGLKTMPLRLHVNNFFSLLLVCVCVIRKYKIRFISSKYLLSSTSKCGRK